MIYYFYLLIMTLLGATGSLFLKKAASKGSSLSSYISDYQFYIGGSLYFLSALLNIIILKYLDFTIVLPLTALTYIWTFIFSLTLLKEKFTLRKMLGTILIITGACVLVLKI